MFGIKRTKTKSSGLDKLLSGPFSKSVQKTLGMVPAEAVTPPPSIESNPFYSIINGTLPDDNAKAQAVATVFNTAQNPDTLGQAETDYQTFLNHLDKRRYDLSKELLRNSPSSPGTFFDDVRELINELPKGEDAENLEELDKWLNKYIAHQQEASKQNRALSDALSDSANRQKEIRDIYGVLDKAEKQITIDTSQSDLRSLPVSIALEGLTSNIALLDRTAAQSAFNQTLIETTTESLHQMRDKFRSAAEIVAFMAEVATFKKDLDENGLTTTRPVKAPKLAKFRPPSH